MFLVLVKVSIDPLQHLVSGGGAMDVQTIIGTREVFGAQSDLEGMNGFGGVEGLYVTQIRQVGR